MSDIHVFNMAEKNASNDDWRFDPITDRQRELIEDKGYEAPDTKGEASDLITEILRKEDGATAGQVRRLEFYGIYGEFSKKEAAELIDKNKHLYDEGEYQDWKQNVAGNEKKKEKKGKQELEGCYGGCGCLILLLFLFFVWRFWSWWFH